MENKKLNLLIIGPISPPAGGISIHIERLGHLLKNDFFIDIIDESKEKKKGSFNLRSCNIIEYIKKILKSDVVFIHSGNIILKKSHLIISKLFLKKTILTFHGFSHRRKHEISNRIDNYFYSLSNKLIFVNKDIEIKNKIAKNKYIIQHAFIPPIKDELVKLPSIIDDRIIIAKINNEIIICANASKLIKFNNEDLYGLDMCITVTERLLRKNIKICFVFVVCSLEHGAELFHQYQKLITDLEIDKNFLLINIDLPFYKLIQKSNIVVRPTNTDGDSLTIREALFLNKKVLASDVTNRPDNTILFKNRDTDDFEEKLITLIENEKNVNQRNYQHKNSTNNIYNDYRELYKKIIQST